MNLRKFKNRVKMARDINQLDRITKEAYNQLLQSELDELEVAIQAKIYQSTTTGSR